MRLYIGKRMDMDLGMGLGLGWDGNEWLEFSAFADCTFAFSVMLSRLLFVLGLKDCIYLQGVYGSFGVSEQL